MMNNSSSDLEIKEDLSKDVFTFGKYKNITLDNVLRDRKYCKWLVQQEWFKKQYEYLYNRVLQHYPRKYFIKFEHLEIKNNTNLSIDDFLSSYEYFHLTPIDKLTINLSEEEKTCYSYYLSVIDSLKRRIEQRRDNYQPNPYDIKAPNGWLKKLERIYGIPRKKFKDFLSAHDLPNLPYIVQDIKEMGGIEYKGAKSYLIAKKRSIEQEKFWEKRLKEKYGENIGTQFKFKNCIFDMINISTCTLYECKLGLKDFNENQHRKYLAVLGSQYSILYPIGKDCIVNMHENKIYTTNLGKYYSYILSIPTSTNPSKFDQLIQNYEVIEVSDITTCI